MPGAELIGELAGRLARREPTDYITLSGSGEPTLNSEIGEVIAWLRGHTDTPIAVLTNGGLLWRGDVRRDVVEADVLVPSLDAATEDVFQQVNRPARGLELTRIVEGLLAARRQCRGQMWLEVMVVAGLNDSVEHLSASRRTVDRIGPHRVQINTVVRPPAEGWAQVASGTGLRRAQRLLVSCQRDPDHGGKY